MMSGPKDPAVAQPLYCMTFTKAFESILLYKAWYQGKAMHCPLKVLRLAIEMSSFTRHIMVQGCIHAQGVDATSLF